MNVSELKQSNFLKKEDVGPGMLVTIRDVEEVNIAKEGAPVELKWAIHFNELEKPMILNSTNGQIIAQITGSEESEGWSGKKIVLYNDPSVSFGGKLTGGIRVRAARVPVGRKPAAKPAPAPAPAQEESLPPDVEPGSPIDDLPF